MWSTLTGGLLSIAMRKKNGTQSKNWYPLLRFRIFPSHLMFVYLASPHFVMRKRMSKSFVKLKYLALTQYQTQRKRIMEKQKKLQTQQRQFELLVDFMVQHSDLAKGQLQCGNAKQRAILLWKKLADDLNSNGPPVRDVPGWKKVWSDLKTHTKIKMRKNKVSISSTGGGVSQYSPLSSLEEQIINLLHMEEAVNGLPTSACFGTNSGSQDISGNKEPSEEVLLSPQKENESSHAAKRSCLDESFQTAKRTRLSNKNDRDILLNTQVENQGIFHKKTTKLLGDIQNNLKELVRYSRKTFELEAKKFDFCKEYKKQKQKIEIDKLELKKKILELELKKTMESMEEVVVEK